MDDQDIIDLYFNRSERAIYETKLKYGKYCLPITKGILSCYEDIEECMDDVLLEAWNSIPPNCPNNLKVYLGKIARNTAIDRLRYITSDKRNAVIINIDDAQNEIEYMDSLFCDVETIISEKILIDDINDFLQKQKRLHRIIFVQKYWYRLDIGQISLKNHISESKTRSILFRLRKKLKNFLKERGHIV